MYELARWCGCGRLISTWRCHRQGTRAGATVFVADIEWSDEETNEPLIADHRNFFKVEKWTKDGKVERMLHAGSSLDKAREPFAAAIKHRPRIRLTIRQRTRVLDEWPKATP